MADQPRPLYYRARDDLTIDGLPIFFGCVEVQAQKVVGRHYRATAPSANLDHNIGYYWLELDASVFFARFEEHGDVEITRQNFEDLLDRWTQQGQYSPFCWNPEHSPEAVSDSW
jgi:hypothetical protein